MSNTFSKNKKELAGVTLVSSSQVWEKQDNGKYRLRRDIDIVGKVDISIPNVVLKASEDGKRTAFVEDVSALPKRTKQELVNHFFDEHGNRNHYTVGYLVRTDPKSKGFHKPKK